MADEKNLPAKLTARNFAVTTDKHGSLVGRGMAAVENNKQLAITKKNDDLYRRAREIYNQLTDYGNVGWCGYKEREQPLTEVFNTFQQLATAGYGKAYFPLCNLYSGEQSVKGDPTQAVLFRKLAFDWLYANQLQNAPEIWHDLAALYVVEENDELANYWIQKAFDAGHSSWGDSPYMQGVVDRLTAEQGNDLGQFKLGLMYSKGRGVEKNNEQAVYWYRKAAEQGYPWSEADLFRDLGIRYRYGDDGTQTDDEKARKYFLLAVNLYRDAAESGEGWGQFKLGLCYRTGHGVEHDDGRAIYWLRKAAVQGDGAGQFALGDMYKSGLGIAQNDEQAVYWFRKSAEQGNDLGQFKLGLMYSKGRGVEKNNEQAVYWYRKAAEQGQALAKLALKNLDFD